VKIVVAACVLMTMTHAACRRESRPFDALQQVARRQEPAGDAPLNAGPPPSIERAVPRDVLRNAWFVGEGKRLFTAFNCVGCHAHGGGAIGPPLADDEWIYGYQPETIFADIVEGRPNGMPSYRNKLSDYQVWQLVAYVRSMSGQTPIDAAPGRDDHLSTQTPEVVRPFEGRRVTGHR
jgi:cytochrome c oxidase cbb3-type subunit 3